MSETLFYLSSGIAFGLAAGVSPGPLTMLIISETLQHNLRAGLKASVAPLLSDTFIISVALGAVSIFKEVSWIFAALSLAGGAYLLFLSVSIFRMSVPTLSAKPRKSRSLLKGIMTNLLNPAPYVFWLTIGAPILLETWVENPTHTVSYLLGIYVFLIGSKAMVAVLVSRGKGFLQSKAYLYVNYAMGLVLAGFGLVFLYRGYEQLLG